MMDRLIHKFISYPAVWRHFTLSVWEGILDDYGRMIVKSVAGGLHPAVPGALEFAMSNLPYDAPIVELGAFCGLSTNLLAHCKVKQGLRNRIIACDSWGLGPAEKTQAQTEQSGSDYGHFLRASFINSITTFCPEPHPYGVEMRPHEFSASWKRHEVVQDVLGRDIELGGPISFCFLRQKGQDYDVLQVLQDCDEYLSSGAFLLLDHCCSFSARKELENVFRHVKSSGKYELLIDGACRLLRRKKPYKGLPTPHIR